MLKIVFFAFCVNIGGVLEPILGISGAHLGPSRGQLGPSWGRLGPSRVLLVSSRAPLRPFWSHLGQQKLWSQKSLKIIEKHWKNNDFLMILGRLGPSGGHLDAILACFWAVLGRLGAIWGLSWGAWEPSWGFLRQKTYCLRHLCVHIRIACATYVSILVLPAPPMCPYSIFLQFFSQIFKKKNIVFYSVLCAPGGRSARNQRET